MTQDAAPFDTAGGPTARPPLPPDEAIAQAWNDSPSSFDCAARLGVWHGDLLRRVAEMRREGCRRAGRAWSLKRMPTHHGRLYLKD